MNSDEVFIGLLLDSARVPRGQLAGGQITTGVITTPSFTTGTSSGPRRPRGLAQPRLALRGISVVAAQDGVLDVPDLFAVVVGPSSLIVDGDVTLDDDLDVPAVEATISEAAASLRERWPIAYVYLTPVAEARPRSLL